MDPSTPRVTKSFNLFGLPGDVVGLTIRDRSTRRAPLEVAVEFDPVGRVDVDALGLRGKVQCIYIDPPYGIEFNSNFQWSTTSRAVTDGQPDHITREPEQVKAFRDTWRTGIHSYLTYLRDRFTVARDLLSPSGSVFVQIGDRNVHRVRALLDEVFGEKNFITEILVKKKG